MVEVIPLKYGPTFKRIFSDTEVFNQFASDVLGIPINVNKVHTEYEYPESVGYVKLKYDLFAEDEETRTIVEIQHIREEDFFDRFLYYHLIALAEQVRGFYAYRFERTVYTIVVLTSRPQPKHLRFSYAVSNMSPVDEFGTQIDLYPHRLIFLSPKSVNDDTPAQVRPWLELIADSLDSQIEAERYDSNLFQQIIERMRRNTLSPEELARIKDESAWEDAKARAKREGREEGIEEGREEGREEGLEAGRREAILEVARSLAKQGMATTLIANATGLDIAEIEAIVRESAET